MKKTTAFTLALVSSFALTASAKADGHGHNPAAVPSSVKEHDSEIRTIGVEVGLGGESKGTLGTGNKEQATGATLGLATSSHVTNGDADRYRYVNSEANFDLVGYRFGGAGNLRAGFGGKSGKGAFGWFGGVTANISLQGNEVRGEGDPATFLNLRPFGIGFEAGRMLVDGDTFIQGGARLTGELVVADNRMVPNGNVGWGHTLDGFIRMGLDNKLDTHAPKVYFDGELGKSYLQGASDTHMKGKGTIQFGHLAVSAEASGRTVKPNFPIPNGDEAYTEATFKVGAGYAF